MTEPVTTNRPLRPITPAKIALVTTTINIPEVLRLYRNCDREVKFFVIGDQKSDHYESAKFCNQISAVYLQPQAQCHWKCSDVIGWNSIQRRNIGFLEALKWGAEIVVSVDDDNIPLHEDYFWQHAKPLRWKHAGVRVSGRENWIDPGAYLCPSAKHRGFPIQKKHAPVLDSVVNARCGVNAGMCLGDPDVDAVTRIADAPDVGQVSLVAESGFVVDPNTWTVFNSQNTAVVREFLPAWGMIPFVGRYDDIYASLVVQRVMRDRECHVRFGRPFVTQERNAHNLVKDLRGELDGMENVVKLANVLDHMVLSNRSVVDDCRQIWRTLSACDWMPGRSVSAMNAWLDDCDRVL